MPPRSFIVSMSPPDYPSAWLRPRSAASVSPGKNIVAPPGPGRLTSGYAVIQTEEAGNFLRRPFGANFHIAEDT